ncbi:hypothetical protein SLEP1_g54081 [Rubroshorea leprosula]|uniref:Uncharacterized protein n=1 Tax=Rubroshorea leprosula TaxID=152421 RepID=A0AAV5MBH1_9ROSI|nr:hypothetical protein SLEP1_g54081 [Rubroshorea leprosula]
MLLDFGEKSRELASVLANFGSAVTVHGYCSWIMANN